MKKWQAYLIIFLILTSGGVGMYKLTRGIRNKNPGNIRFNKANNWDGQIGKDLEGFAQFSDAKFGIRAMTKLIKNYYYKYGLNSINLIISRYAPSSENNTLAYAEAVGRAVGIGARDMVNLENEEVLFKLIKAMIFHENGLAYYSDDEIRQGMALA